MAKFTQEQLSKLTVPASDTETEKLERARIMVKDALQSDENFISSTRYTVFGQGSYANNTNVRQNSDVDINVCYTNYFFFDIPQNETLDQHNITLTSDTYTYDEFKKAVHKALVKKFGSDNVIVKNKCFHVKENTYHSEIDVVPTVEYRKYRPGSGANYAKGVKYTAKDGTQVINYPLLHIENGKTKNVSTSMRFKSIARILKNLKYKMEDDNYYKNPNVTSFLLECLAYNLPNDCYHVGYTCNWNQILKDGIIYWYHAADTNDPRWKRWTEVSGELYLMSGHKWSNLDVREFMLKLWNYLEFE